ncbi:MAG: DUF1501 domain-containing protein [Pirellulales bacterium]
MNNAPPHPVLTRRASLQAGAIGLLGCGMNHVAALRAEGSSSPPPARACIYIFLSGGLSQLDSFDLKPAAPAGIRGEFEPISTNTPGLQICEHLPQLAQRSHLWSLCRSLTHKFNEHSEGHLLMLTGRSELPPNFNGSLPQPTDWPSIAAVAGAVAAPRNNLPPAMILPERLVHNTGRVIPGQGAGRMGATRDPWFIEASPFTSKFYGAYPQYAFDHVKGTYDSQGFQFQAPNLTLPEGLGNERFGRRVDLLKLIGGEQRALDRAAESEKFDRFRQKAISLLADGQTQRAFDVDSADPAIQDRYGRNSFGKSLLMARQLVEAGVSLVQVNLGNNESWDTHGNAFPNLKDFLFPPTDRAVSALLDDLQSSGLLDSTLVVMAGEFGRTPYISGGGPYKSPGRNHWGGVQSVFFAGGGVQGGRVIGASDKQGGTPALHPQHPENMAASIYQALWIPPTAAWNDSSNRPHFIYHGDPIPGLS